MCWNVTGFNRSLLYFYSVKFLTNVYKFRNSYANGMVNEILLFPFEQQSRFILSLARKRPLPISKAYTSLKYGLLSLSISFGLPPRQNSSYELRIRILENPPRSIFVNKIVGQWCSEYANPDLLKIAMIVSAQFWSLILMITSRKPLGVWKQLANAKISRWIKW